MFTLGFDVAKDHVDVALINKAGTATKERWQVPNTVPAITELLSAVHTKHPKLQAGCEATGYYHLPVVQACAQTEMSCYVLNPLMTKQYTKVRCVAVRQMWMMLLVLLVWCCAVKAVWWY